MVISDDDSDIEFGDIHPTPNYQRILQQKANLSSSPAFSAGNILLRNALGKGERSQNIAEAMSSVSPPSSPSTKPSEVERLRRSNADPQLSVTVYVFIKVWLNFVL